jgi:FtsP/CotA-like multicopper oxidase with cupredoxin domain
MSLSRRDLIKISVLGGAAVALPLERSVSAASALGNRIASSRLPAPFTTPFAVPPVISPVRSDPVSVTDFYRITMKPTFVEIVPGLPTQMWGYNGLVPGPTFRIQRGRKTVVRQINNLPPVHPVLKYVPYTSVHLHGSVSLPQYDGYASDITNPGEYKDYHYPNTQHARTLWYHDHGVHHTAENVSMGLAGQYHIIDALEQSLPIPHGEFDVPLTVGDTMLNSDGSLLFEPNDESGFFGDVILVNGRPWPVMQVKKRKYRFRILNASVSRSFRWSLSTGDTMTVIGTDGGLVPTPIPVTTFRHGVAERYEVVIDFKNYPVGTRIILRNGNIENDINFTNTNKVMAFDVVGDAFDPSGNLIPDVLDPTQPAMLVNETDSIRTRTMEFVRDDGQWTINGGTWDDVIASHFTKVLASPRTNDVEVWNLVNKSGGWHHPAHIHFIDFRILSRNGRPPQPQERGAKDTAFLGENESVRVLIKFDDGRGKYMEHCHNLVHEDHDMMGQFNIIDPNRASDDPFSAPAQRLPEGPL